MIVEVEQDVYDELCRRMKVFPEKIPDVLRNTINSTAKKAEKDWAKKVKETYVLKQAAKRVKDATVTERATARQPQATVEVKGGTIPLSEFQKRKNGIRAAAKAKVLRSGGLKKLQVTQDGEVLKAFVLTIKNRKKGGGESEHAGIFRRFPRSEIMQKGKKRNAIKQLYGPPIPEMAGNDSILAAMEEEIRKNMEEELGRHISAVMGGM